MSIKRYGDKILLTNEKISRCDCCCPYKSCDEIEIPSFEEVYDAFKFIGGGLKNPATNQVYGSDAFNSPVAGRFSRSPACLRFYYRAVNEDKSEEGEVLCQGALGPEGARDGLSAAEEVYGYRNDKPNLLVGESCGIYIYHIEFYYWVSRCSGLDPESFWNAKGGAQPPDCDHIRIYNVDMFTVGQTLWAF